MGQKERNKATEVVDGVVETVDVSKHPTASIEPSDLSLADIERLAEVHKSTPNLVGAIIGRALYEGVIQVEDAVKAVTA